MELFTEFELMIMALVLGALVLLILILSIGELFSKKQEKRELNINEDNKDTLYEYLDKLYEEKVNNVASLDLNNDKTSENLVFEEVSVCDHVEESIKEEVIEPLILEIDSEVEVNENIVAIKIEDESLKQLDVKEKAQIELLKLETELEHELSLEDTITNLEAIEEENAIISYQELLSNTKELDVVYADDGDEPITINEVFKLFNEQEGLMVTESLDTLPLEEAYKGDFVATPYVSPLSGLETESLSEIQLENTANLEKLDKEIRKTNEFLNILNELKKNLE